MIPFCWVLNKVLFLVLPWRQKQKKRFLISLKALLSAEEAGFEPAVPFPVRQFSKLFLSATQAPFLVLTLQT